MPVRIIFRGLVLFKVDEAGGEIVAKLVGPGRASPGGGGAVSPSTTAGHAGHGTPGGGAGTASTGDRRGAHRHEAELQAFSVRRRPVSGREEDRADYLQLGIANIDIAFDGGKPYPAKRAASYEKYCPRLADIMDSAAGSARISTRCEDPSSPAR